MQHLSKQFCASTAASSTTHVTAVLHLLRCVLANTCHVGVCVWLCCTLCDSLSGVYPCRLCDSLSGVCSCRLIATRVHRLYARKAIMEAMQTLWAGKLGTKTQQCRCAFIGAAQYRLFKQNFENCLCEKSGRYVYWLVLFNNTHSGHLRDRTLSVFNV